MAEIEPNRDLRKSPKLEGDASKGLGINGRMDEPGDIDCHRVFLKKGRVRIDVFASEYGSPIDSLINVYDEKGKNFGGNDDKTRGNPDSGLDFNVPRDGWYTLRVYDRLRRGGDAYVYRVEVSKPQPSVVGTLNRSVPQDGQRRRMLCIPQGGQMTYKFTLAKKNFRGQLELFAKNLPAGVTIDKCVIGENQSSVTFMLRAASNAPLGGKLCAFELVGKGVKGYIREVIEHSFVPNRGVFHSYSSNYLPVAVIKPSPVKVWLEAPAKPIVRNGSLVLKVKVDRGGYKRDINVGLIDKPSGVGANSIVKIPANKSEVSYSINANSGAALGKHKLAVVAYLSRHGELLVGSDWATIDLKEPLLKMKLSMASTQQGKNVSVVGTIEGDLKHHAKVRLVGLPDGLKAREVSIAPGSKTVSLPVEVPANARVGKFSHLYCVANVTLNGQQVPHAVGHGGVIRVDRKPPPPKTNKPAPKVATIAKPKPKAPVKPAAKPLSRLEQLRQKRGNK